MTATPLPPEDLPPKAEDEHFVGQRIDAPRGLDFRRVKAVDVDFSHQAIDPVFLYDSQFDRCDFSGVTFGAGQISGWDDERTIYTDCTFDRADLREPTFMEARFVRCSFVGARLDGVHLGCVEFVDCRFEGRMRNLQFWGTADDCEDEGRTVNEFRGNDFTNADLRGSEFRGGIDMTAQALPSGPEYVYLDRFHARVAKARLSLSAPPSTQETMEALREIDLLADIYGEQVDLFMSRRLPGDASAYELAVAVLAAVSP